MTKRKWDSWGVFVPARVIKWEVIAFVKAKIGSKLPRRIMLESETGEVVVYRRK